MVCFFLPAFIHCGVSDKGMKGGDYLGFSHVLCQVCVGHMVILQDCMHHNRPNKSNYKNTNSKGMLEQVQAISTKIRWYHLYALQSDIHRPHVSLDCNTSLPA